MDSIVNKDELVSLFFSNQNLPVVELALNAESQDTAPKKFTHLSICIVEYVPQTTMASSGGSR